MLKERLDFYRSILLEKRTFILNTIERLKDISQISENDSGQHDRYSSHLADEGSYTAGIENAFMLVSRELQYLNKIKSAYFI